MATTILPRKGSTGSKSPDGEEAIQNIRSNANQERLLYDFEVKDLVISSDRIQFTFEVQPKETLSFPNGNIISATQKGRQLKHSSYKGVCEVHKGDEIYEGSLISKNNALNGNSNFVLLTLKDGNTIKITQPDKIISYQDTVKVNANPQGSVVKITMSMEGVLNTEFEHTISESKGDNDDGRDEGFYMEQTVAIENNSTVNFRKCPSTRITVPTSNQEDDTIIENQILTLTDVGDLTSHSKETYVFSDTKLQRPRFYVMISTLKHDKSQCICEFTLPEHLFPGKISQFDTDGNLVDISHVSFKKSGDKLILSRGIADYIKILTFKYDNIKFNLEVENSSTKDENIYIEEIADIQEVYIDDIKMEGDIFILLPGKHIIRGLYKQDDDYVEDGIVRNNSNNSINTNNSNSNNSNNIVSNVSSNINNIDDE